MAAALQCVYDNAQMFSQSGAASRLPKPYLPSIPPVKTRRQSYSRFVQDAPLMALSGTRSDMKRPPKSPNIPKGQKRALVGLTNRWRLPENVNFDLLGSSQAMKSVFAPYSGTFNTYKTDDCLKLASNHCAAHLSCSSQVGLNDEKRLSLSSLHKPSRLNIQAEPSRFDFPNHFQNSLRPESEFSTQPKSSAVKTQLQQVRFDKNIAPLGCQEPTPMEMFLYHSQATTCGREPDVILYAFDTAWELHKPFFQKSGLLSEMVNEASQRPVVAESIPEEIVEEKQSSVRSAVDLHAVKSAVGVSKSRQDLNSVLQLVRTPSVGRALVVKLKVKDPLLSKQAFSLALGSLYMDHIKMDDTDVVGVLAAASLLEFRELKRTCVDMMLKSISVSTVCAFHSVATKYKQLAVIEACGRWLELNLVPQLSLQIYLGHLRQEVLEKLLKSSRLFTWNEYSLYKLLSYWIFVHQHPKIRVMPSWGSVVTWFMSLPKTTAFLERAEGQGYTSLLRSLRLVTITESVHLDEIQKMNIIPQSWLLHIYSQNYHALQGGGGDMSLLTKFENGAVRVGFLLDQSLQYHSDILSLHGFHFGMKAVHEGNRKYLFYLQRLLPNEPVLSFKTCERQTFSLRQDREVRYNIRVQWEADETTQVYSSGILSQAFGFSEKTKKSEIITLYGLQPPIYVTFSIMFPTS